MSKSFSFKIVIFLFGIIFFSQYLISNAQEHPRLTLTKKGVTEIRKNLGKIPLFDKTLAIIKKSVDAEIVKPIAVPIPKDMAGGYTHDQHKKNWKTLHQAGALYQILQDKKYAIYVHEVLKQYATMYPKLPLHPQERSYARGKIFWQCLNDSNWLVYVSQAYDCIYDFLSKKERKNLEENLFKPYANFLSEETPQFFNRIHNHSTWGNVAVGMIGLAMDDEVLIKKALYGLETNTIDPNQKDNDGGFIKPEGQGAGFLANLDEPFSPDGYYTEGPYYQRYAMYPFMIFAQALENAKPELKIFEHKNGVLIKAVNALLNLTDADGEFFALNDAQKGMSYYNGALVSAVDIAYYFGEKDPSLLSIAEKQGKVQLDDTGLAVALALTQGKAKEFDKQSIELTDGSDGTEGAVHILRSKGLELVMKNTAHGLSHGHFDKLSFSYFDSGKEILQDYGLARFVNIEQKNGGGYLKENKTWAKQTIAHNTIVQDQTSHFQGKFKIGNKHHSEKYLFNISNPKLQVTSAKEENAYPNTKLHRTMFLFDDSAFENPVLIDVFQFNSNTAHQYDLPFYYHGQIIDMNFEHEAEKTLSSLGDKNGYQHLWLEGKELFESDTTAQIVWKNNDQFHTLSTLVKKGDEFLFTRIGANDPKFNLRRDASFIVRKPKTSSEVYINVIETHGSYSTISESAKNTKSNIKSILNIELSENGYLAFSITTQKNEVYTFVVCTSNADKNKRHSIKINGTVKEWLGPFTNY